MPLLLRLLLCLTLLANTAGGAWAASGGGHGAVAAHPPSVACHEGSAEGAMAMHGQAHAAVDAGHEGNASADPGCCKHAGCDCLQHCSSSLNLPTAHAAIAPRARQPLPAPGAQRGLPRPYQPVRPPIA